MPFHLGDRGVFLFAGGMGTFLLALHRIAFLGAHGQRTRTGLTNDSPAFWTDYGKGSGRTLRHLARRSISGRLLDTTQDDMI